MESLRKRQTDAIKGGGFHVAILRVTGHTLEQNHVNTNKEAPSPTNDENSDIDEKKEFIIDLNEKFSLLMRTKVDAQAVIMKAKQKFPLDSIFERYEDELAVLFNETAFRGSEKCKEASTFARCNLSPTHTNQGPNDDNMQVLCTPTKLNFDNTESLDELAPLSPYWYSQTTYGLIDAQIEQKSGCKIPTDEAKGNATCNEPSCEVDPGSISAGTNLHIVPVTEADEQPVPI
ncbi:hypothetical protein L6452_13539 [Arctium lappa]|uniref:Uncharacterized protein n=1 Tax=Arctium lappa TaxID=4217 RepID=A0ACB9CIE3_ARCLA|nr:hypothetical protein L6452_13539 [Arctium lappa]